VLFPSDKVSTPEMGNPKRTIGQRTFDFSRELAIMAIINRTRDSFYDRGQTFTLDSALTAIGRAIDAGADWIDIGAVPFSPLTVDVTEQQELDRVIPLIEAVRPRTDVVISIDTFRSSVARSAFSAGADVINDTSGLSDPDMANVIAQARGAVIVTHSKAGPRQWLSRPTYDDVVSEVRDFLIRKAQYAVDEGVNPNNIIIDPGHDLNKNTYHSLELTRRLNELNNLGHPLLVSVSNKDFIAEALGSSTENINAGTLVALAVCVLQGARIVRVHDVTATISAMSAVGTILGVRMRGTAK
jgi:dihydropteroate synthase